jgi:hypothetical protein
MVSHVYVVEDKWIKRSKEIQEKACIFYLLFRHLSK